MESVMAHSTRSAASNHRIARDRLIHEYVGMAQRISLKMVRCGGPRVSREDAVAAAMLGLTEAAERFDASRGEPFVAFAEKRIRGAVLDELRRGDVLPRRVRRVARRAAQVRAQLETAGGAATDDAMAEAMGVTLDEYRADVAPLAEVTVQSIETAAGYVLTTAWPTPAAIAERREAIGKVEAVVEKMAPRDAKIIALHYGDDLPYRAIGRQLGLTASRVCQLHERAIEHLRAQAA
jgi:RNA polymerase sigma factor FliA